MKTWQKFLGLMVLSTHFWSCTMDRRTHVVERSKKDIPSWSEMTPLELVEIDRALRMVMVRKDMRDLPLAIKQTQYQATGNLTVQLLELLAKPVRLNLLDSQATSQARQELVEILETLAKHEIFQRIQVQDIYFETYARLGPITGDANSTHDVYVLVEFSNDAHRDLQTLFREALSRANSTSLRQYGFAPAKSEL